MRHSSSSKKQRGCDSNVMKRVDIYGIPITLNFEDKMRYKTNFGAMMSIFTCLTVLVFGGFSILDLFRHANTKIRMYPENVNLMKADH